MTCHISLSNLIDMKETTNYHLQATTDIMVTDGVSVNPLRRDVKSSYFPCSAACPSDEEVAVPDCTVLIIYFLIIYFSI